MRLIARTLLPLMMLFCASVSGHAQESYKDWWKFLQGEWEYAISSPLDETGTATWRIAAKRSALVLRTVAENGVVGMELCGWQADKKRLLANGYASDGSCWTIESTKIEEIQGFPTVVKSVVSNLQTGSKTEMEFGKVKYDLNLKDSIFTERYLRRPPREAIR